MKFIRTALCTFALLASLLALPALTVAAHPDQPGAPLIVLALELVAINSMSPRDPRKLVFGLLGDNSPGILSGTIIAQRTLEFLKVMFPQLGRISTNFSDQGLLFQQQMYVQVPSAQTAAAWNKDTGYVVDTADTTQVGVKIDKHDHVSFGFNDQEVSATNRDLISEHAETSAFALGSRMFSYVFGLLNTTAILHEYKVANADWNRRSVIDINGILNGRGVSGLNRFGIVNSRAMAELQDDLTIVSAQVNPSGSGIINSSTGGMVHVHGVDVFEWPNIPGTHNLSGIFGTKQGLCVAGGVPQDPASVNPGVPIPGKIDIVTDPSTGMSLMVREHYDMQKGFHQVTLTWMYGASIGLPLTIERTVTDDSGLAGAISDTLD